MWLLLKTVPINPQNAENYELHRAVCSLYRVYGFDHNNPFGG